MQVLLWDMHSAVVYSSSYLISYEVPNDKIGLSTIISVDYLGQLNHAQESWPTLSIV